ncbi:MAG: patatin-like phospholipase family protein [Planctomycetota bacterium]
MTDEERAPLAEWLARGPFHLALSAGWFGYAAHAALLDLLDERGLTPVSVSGASGGAVAAVLWSGGLRGARLRDLVTGVSRREILRLRPGPGLFSARALEGRLHRELGGLRLEDAAIPVAVSVCDWRGREVRALSRGCAARAAHASLAVPGVMHPVRVEGRLCVDGGWRDPYALVGAPATRVLVHDVRRRRPEGPPLGRDRGRRLRQEDRPRFGPFSLHRAEHAWRVAREEASRLLDRLPTAAVGANGDPA